MMLRHLEAQFLRYVEEAVDPMTFIDGVLHTDGVKTTLVPVATLDDAHGIKFRCPQCFYGTRHHVICWFEGKVPDHARPSPGRWTPQGTDVDDLTFIPGTKVTAVSVQLVGGCGWHGFVKNGVAE